MIYLDNAATTKPYENSLIYAERFLKEAYFNPSALYRQGLEVKTEINKAREEILSHFPKGYNLIFTSGGTEADNTAAFSSVKRGNAVTTLGEHSAVYETFCSLKTKGKIVNFAPLKPNGKVDEDKLLSLIDESTDYVSVVHVNNETGAINDINKIAKRAKAINPRLIFHSDGVQAFGKISYSVSDDVDMYTISAHKIHAVKGVGALIYKKNLHLTPMIYGGGQEGNLRSGTENVFGISVFGNSAAIQFKDFSEKTQKFYDLKNAFLSKLDLSGFQVISDDECSPHIVSISAKNLRGEVLQHMMEDFGIIIGTGSACSSKSRHSRILKNCGYGDKILDGALRISFSVENTEEEAIFAAEKLNDCYKKLKGVMKV